MNYVLSLGKYLDQPLLVSKLSNSMPKILVGSAASYGLYNVYKAPERKKKKTLIKNIVVLGFTVSSALIATKGLKLFNKQIIPGLSEIKLPAETIKHSKRILDRLTRILEKSPNIDKNTKNIFSDAKTNILLNKLGNKITSRKEIQELYELIGSNDLGKKLLSKLIPSPESSSSRKIFGEIGRLSLLGLIPVTGGILGGITADYLTEKRWQKKISNKIKEGAYQYLANIFLCNVGAGGALAIMEKFHVRNKIYKAAGMITGICITGVIGGSAIANLLCKKCIDPLVCKKKVINNENNSLFSERKPETLDIVLHCDDIATVAVMSGLKWIEPVLPILYSISGERAGIGYRNGKCQKQKQKQENAIKLDTSKTCKNSKNVFKAFMA